MKHFPVPDYHIHTYLCGHASGQPYEYVEHAISLGFSEIGFSDHAPMVSHRDPTVTMAMDELPLYHKMIEQVKEKYKDAITVKVGIEADFIPGYEAQTEKILQAYPYDYVIGSVHYIGDWGFDNSDEQEKLKKLNINDTYRAYHKLLRKCAQSGLFDIMAHTDLVKKFGHFPTEDISDEIIATAEIFKECKVAIELNTSGLRKPAREMYPALATLKLFFQHGVPLIFGSDSHRPQEVGMDFNQAIAAAQRAGYRECLRFRQRKIEEVVSLV